MERQCVKNLVSKLLGFVFIPNSNAIYLHDTPKYLLVEKKEPLANGCIGSKPAELA
jgi:murein L,D-transpeptidase YcbB/YkuD